MSESFLAAMPGSQTSYMTFLRINLEGNLMKHDSSKSDEWKSGLDGVQVAI